MLDKIRYGLALLMMISLPPAVLYWYLIHPFAERWRRLPAWATFGTVTLLVVPVGVALYRARESLLRVDFGFSWPLTVAAVLLYGLAAWIEVRCRKHLKFRILAGVPEVSGGASPGQLLTEGIYAHIRNPRYLDLWIGVLAVALFVNYLAIYLVWLLSIPALWLVVLLEERELQRRFGDAYADYCRRVPRFLPRWRGAGSPTAPGG